MAGLLGAGGSLVFSIGIGMWTNWLCIIGGALSMFACVRIIDKSFAAYEMLKI